MNKSEGAGENGDEELKASEPIAYSCDTCGVDCTHSRYHSIRRLKPDSDEAFDVCPSCYTEGRFPSNLFSGDFLRLDGTTSHKRPEQMAGHDWTDQETLLLLEGMEMFHDDWDKISEHVATRTREECISHFLQLPIEDEFLVEGGTGINGGGSGLSRADRLPFNQAEHPVLSVVAFLASVVDPEVAAKAASDSVKELTESLKRKADGLKQEENGEVEERAAAASEQEGQDNAMAVDGEESAAAQDQQAKEGTEAEEKEKKESSPSKAASSSEPLHRSANLALASAASKAYLLSLQTSSTLTSQIHSLVSTQVQKLSLKMAQFEEVEASLDNERRQIAMARQLLQMERLGIEKQLEAVNELSGKILKGVGLQPGEVERVREMGRKNTAEGSFRSGMPPRTVQVQGQTAEQQQAPLNGTQPTFTELE